jgi:SAM-dependent methyltransferase
MASSPPRIFSTARRMARRERARVLQRESDAARFVIDDMVEEVLDRLSFTRHAPARSLVIGDWTGQLAARLPGEVEEVDIDTLDLEQPYPSGGYDLIACLGLLDCVNDLPGALIHMHRALAPGGMVIASFTGAGSLPVLRQVMQEADGDRPAARVHPMVDVRAGAQLLQRAGWADPVADSHTLRVRYGSLERLVEDLRAQGLGCALSSVAPHVGKAGVARAKAAFAARTDDDGRVTESFEIVTLTGRRR